MVIRKNAMRKNVRQSILRSFGRYIAIAMIIALGAGLFIGLLMTKTDMVATGQAFTDGQNMFDLRAMGSYGWTEEYVEAFQQLEGIQDAEGQISLDVIARTGASGEDAAYRFYSIPERINKVALRAGRMPQAPNECLADGYHAKKYYLGRTVTLSEENDGGTLDLFQEKDFTIVGLVASPLYMDMNRGSTSIGSGSLDGYYYVLRDAFDMDYYTEIDLTLTGDYAIYTDAYNDALDDALDALEPEAKRLNLQRFREAKRDAEEKYQEGFADYCQGLRDYCDGKAEAEQELRDAEQTLLENRQKLEDSRKQLEDAEKQIVSGRAQLRSAKSQLAAGREELAQKKAAASVQMATAREELDQNKLLLTPMYQIAQAAMPAAQKKVADLQEQLSALDPENNPLDAILAQSLQAQLSLAQETVNRFQETIDGMAAIEDGYRQLEDAQAQLDAAQAQLEDAQQEIIANESRLLTSEKEVKEGWKQLESGEKELEEGQRAFEQAKLDAEAELKEAKQELEDARQSLIDGRKAISDMTDTQLYLLDRNSNVGFANLDSNSDIVAGVSRVFPAFFLLVASLVCITTMTRMIDEERTQIGTLKALGYSSGAIIGKYMVYSGSGALLGCGLGIAAGCTVFPQIIWKAYCMMLYIQPNVVLTVDWTLCIAVVLVYTAVMLLVTWYCCHKTLEEEPASLIRPKAPDGGKKILLERLSLWSRISFLNKVTIRNIFRYRQRLAMMLVGIGGCTALLVTGFGLRDSIVNVMDYQFDNVTRYDLNVYFQEENTPDEQSAFLAAAGVDPEQALFYHQSNVEMNYNNQAKEVYLLSAGQTLLNFLTMRAGEEEIAMPGDGEVVLSIGVAENMGVRVGDTILLRNSDMETLEVTVSGIYENHVYNYAIVLPETIQDQWGALPENQMAFLQADQGVDPHTISAAIAGLGNVAAVSVNADMANIIRNMMDAFDMVVLLIIFCAGLLAVTVLYNLTNININERIREIATIKVLGFNAAETSAYVFKENLALTVGGALLGLAVGKLLLMFVIDQIRIDMIWFKPVAEPMSYVLAIALTLLSAVVVNVIFSKKLDQINMAEALKSVE